MNPRNFTYPSNYRVIFTDIGDYVVTQVYARNLGLRVVPPLPPYEYDVLNFGDNPLTEFVHPDVSCSTLQLSGTLITTLQNLPPCKKLLIHKMESISMIDDGPFIDAEEVRLDSKMADPFAAYLSPKVKQVVVHGHETIGELIESMLKDHHGSRFDFYLKVMFNLSNDKWLAQNNVKWD